MPLPDFLKIGKLFEIWNTHSILNPEAHKTRQFLDT
jgi:hypothetical protein